MTTKLDWRELSGPRVSRRTLMKFAGATGSLSLMSWLAACGGGDDDDGDGEDEGAAAGDATATTAPSTDEEPTATMAEASGEATQPAAQESEATEAPAEEPTEAPAEGEGQQGGTLQLGFGTDQIPTLDPAQSHDSDVAGYLISNLFSSLVQFDLDLSLVGDLAEDWEVSEDGTEYTFHLREGLTFHNGDPLVAEDIIYTYERTIDPDYGSAHAYKLELIEQATAEDDLTVKFTMSEPFAPFLAVACVRGPGRAMTPVSRRAVEEMGDEQFGLTPVGAGPFMMVPESREVGGGFDMVAFEDWYGGRPMLDQITVQIIPEPSSQISALEAGDIDMIAELVPSGYEQVAANDDFTIVEGGSTDWRSVSLNMNRSPWDNPTARMAVAKAINRQEFIERAHFGVATECTGPIQPAFGWAYRPPEEVDNPQAFDLEEAQRLAEEAGLDGVQPVFISTGADQRNVEVIRLMLQDIGLEVEIDLLQNTVHREREEAGEFDMSLWGSGGDADPDDAFWNFFHSEGARNVTGLNNATVDENLEGARRSTDMEERARMYQEAEQVLREEVPCVFTRHLPDLVAFHNDVKGYKEVPSVRYLETTWLDR